MDVRKGRKATEVRPVRMIRGYTKQAPGSVLIQLGETWVLCTVSIQEGVPKWREESGLGWLTAEYDMLPGSTGSRRPRNREGVDGRSQEIQRLIGRSLRAVVDFTVLGSRTLVVDCDVLQADGGTRSAAITGGYVALCDAVDEGVKRGLFDRSCVTDSVAAVSVGVVKDKILQSVRTFIGLGAYTDDVTLVVVKWLGNSKE